MSTKAISPQLTKEQKVFAEYPVIKAVAIMVIPCVISQLVMVLYNLADTFFIGLTNNPAAVAGLSLCLPISHIKTAIANLFGIGGASVIARAIGQKKEERAKSAFSIALRGGLILAIVYCLLISIISKPFLLLIGADQTNIAYATQYALVVIGIGGVPAIMSMIFAHLVRSTGRSKVSSFGIMLGAFLNIGLDPLFMFVILPPGNEVLGSAIATALANIISMLFLLIYILKIKKEPIFKFKLEKNTENSSILKNILACGLPSFVLSTASQISNFFLNSMLATMGSSSTMAGIGIVRKIDSLAYSVNQGITQGMLPIVAYCYGAKKYKRMKSVAMFSALCTIIFSLACCVVSYVFAPELVGLFIQDSETIFYGAQFLRVLCISVGIYPLLFVIIAMFQAVGQSLRPFILSILHKGSFDIILFFVIRALFGVKYILWAAPIMAGVAVLIAVVEFIRYYKKLDKEQDVTKIKSAV